MGWTAAGGEVVLALPPMIRSPDEPMLMRVPEMVTAGSPAFIGVPAI